VSPKTVKALETEITRETDGPLKTTTAFETEILRETCEP
jgi:hypothetical protein